MTISSDEYKLAKGNPSKLQALYDREYKQYLLDGGIITRKEKDASITLWASLDGEKLHPVQDVTE